MITREEIVAEIAARPTDERPHRMLADWLDENGLHDEASYHRRWTINVAMSELWLRKFVDSSNCPNYDHVIAAAIGNHKFNSKSDYDDDDNSRGYYRSENDGEYLHFGGRDAHGEIPPEFWYHIEIAMGIKIDGNMRAKWFSCSC